MEQPVALTCVSSSNSGGKRMTKLTLEPIRISLTDEEILADLLYPGMILGASMR